MYTYDIYGLTVACNEELYLLKKIVNEKADVTINVFYRDIKTVEWDSKEIDGIIRIRLGTYAIYTVDINNNIICCEAPDFNSFFSTLFNIPFSVYLFGKGNILFHSSSLVSNGNIFAFAGDKGMGKSTLVSILKNTEHFKIFADDTLRITENLLSYPPHNLIKLTQETADNVGIKGLDARNITGKIYDEFDLVDYPLKLRVIFQIYREKIPDFRITPLNDNIMVNKFFIKNIVGLSYFPKDLMKKALRLKVPGGINLYRLDVPDNMSYLIAKSDLLSETLSKTI